jgi:hypothetical protein
MALLYAWLEMDAAILGDIAGRFRTGRLRTGIKVDVDGMSEC